MWGLAITFVIWSSLGFGAPDSAIWTLFESHYKERYTERSCGKNILAFAEALSDPEDFYIVTIENTGLSVFGMVNAEVARGETFRKPSEVEKNWYHHVIMLDSGGLVYDFDFTTSARIVPIEQYLEKMFLDEPECNTPRYGEFCGGRENKLKDYIFESTPVPMVLRRGDVKSRKASLGDVLKNWKTLLH